MTDPSPASQPDLTMPMNSTLEDVFALPVRLDTDASEKLRQDLIEKRGSDLTLDASAVTRLGGLCATILASAAQSWAGDGHKLQIISPSDEFTACCERLGFPLPKLNAGEAE